MIRIFLFTVFFFAQASHVNAQYIPNFDNSPKGGEKGQTIAFVAEKVELEEIKDYCPQDYICMDAKFNARYRIVELLEGNFEGNIIDFVVYDHYGKPRFSNHDLVVLYVFQADNGYVHHKYSYDILNTVNDSKYAYCGDPYTDYEVAEIEENGRKNLTSFDFSPRVKFKLSKFLADKEDIEHMEQDDIREDFLEIMRKFAPPAFKIRGNSATCEMGMTAKQLASVRMLYEFIPQREREEKREKCWEEAGLPDDSANAVMREESGFNACMKE